MESDYVVAAEGALVIGFVAFVLILGLLKVLNQI